MDADELARAGEPFYTTKPAGVGTGLGLFVTRSAIDQLGGTVTLSVAAWSGHDGDDCLPQKCRDRRAENGGCAMTERPLVLIAEDDAPLRERLARAFEARGFEVQAAATFAEAEAHIAGTRPSSR
jgi:hypothetical protein